MEGALNDVDWSVKLPAIEVQLCDFVAEAKKRKRLVRRAERTIVEDTEVMGGLPVFRGTRVPVATVAASRRAGLDMDQLRQAYPFLTPELVVDAETYLQVHPRVGRPRKDVNDERGKAKLVSSKRVALPRRQ